MSKESRAASQESLTKQLFFRKRHTRVCSVCANGENILNYKAVKFLSKFISERGRMLPRRITGLCACHQRKLKTEIKKARLLALLPFVNA